MFFPFVCVERVAGIQAGEFGFDAIGQFLIRAILRITLIVLGPKPMQNESKFLADAALRIVAATGRAIIRRPGKIEQIEIEIGLTARAGT